jgi:hypothetical protein
MYFQKEEIMNLIQNYQFVSSLLFYLTFHGTIFALFRLLKMKRLNWGFFFSMSVPVSFLLLRLSGYYIRKEQIILFTLILFWSALKAFQCFRYDICAAPKESGVNWLLKISGLTWLVMLPFNFYLSSRPVYSSPITNLIGLSLVTISLIYDGYRVLNPFKEGWGKIYTIFNPGTILCIWGLFIFISPQLMGTEWLTLAGPILYSALVMRPWIILLTGSKLTPPLSLENDYSIEKDDYLIFPYSEDNSSQIALQASPDQYWGGSIHNRIIPNPSHPDPSKVRENHGYGI